MSVFHQLFDNYNDYHVSAITTNRFSPDKFQQILLSLAGEYPIKQLGNSVEGRPINSITLGNGPVRILLWSQMHGNESTATRAILDILQFMGVPKEMNAVQTNILDKLTICMVPILNPDGTVLFQRRNGLNIDINRDARAFESPESQILKAVIADFKAEFAFNLHDQRRFYNVTGTSKPSTIAFLAPAFDASEEINPTRKNAMQLIAHLRQELETVIPGQIGIYDETYTPRAFGDYTQGAGVSTILVESGWEHDDMEKEIVRKLNFSLLVSAFDAIAEGQLQQSTVDDYKTIPMNDERLFDLLIKNINVEKTGHQFKFDLGIQRTEESIADSTDFYSLGEVADIGDLEDWYGFDEIDDPDLLVAPGMVWPEPFAELKDITILKASELTSSGYLYAKVEQESNYPYVKLPINLVPDGFVPDPIPVFEGRANLLLKSRTGELKYVVVNGFLWKIGEPLPDNINGLIL
jgi:hypothetical protein